MGKRVLDEIGIPRYARDCHKTLSCPSLTTMLRPWTESTIVSKPVWLRRTIDLATWIPCAWLWVSSTFSRRFFSLLSTCLYEMLTDSLYSADSYVCVQKRVTTKRWSCRADASNALLWGYLQIRDVLAKTADDPDEMPKVRCEANG